PACIPDDSFTCACQFASVIPITRTPKRTQPVVRVRLKDRGAGSCDLSAFAPQISRCTHQVKASMRSRKLWGLRKGSLSCGLFGAIDIHDQPVVTQTVPQSTRWKGLSRLGDEVILKESSQSLNTWRIQSGQKATERGTMRQLLAMEQGHERDRKGG